MGSRIMHLAVADQVCNELRIEERDAFLLGSIAADAAASKDDSHFYKGRLEDGTRDIDVDFFIEKYCAKLENPFVLGYLTHLVADQRWLKFFYLAWLKERLERDDSLLERYHHDFFLLNRRLIHRYGMHHVKGILERAKARVQLDEVTRDALQEIKKDAIRDFETESEEGELQVFTMEQIENYIEKSVRQSLDVIQRIKEGAF